MAGRIRKVKRTLKSLIHETAQISWLFSKRPGKDFTRKSKLSFEETISFLLAMEGKSLNNELMQYFKCSKDTPSASAIVQCRSKMLPEAMAFLFRRFASEFGSENTYKGFRLLAVDGSDVHVPTNPNDTNSFFAPKNGRKPYNLVHLNAMYDLLGNTYTDAVIQGAHICHERRALIQMVDRSSITSAIVLADRGYEGYNTLAHIQEKGWKFLFRVKDGGTGIVPGLNLPDTETFDSFFDMHITRRENKEAKSLLADRNRFKLLAVNQPFDFLPAHNKKDDPISFYSLPFRIVRFKISDSSVETLITNLDPDSFPVSHLKKLYALRWGIETSFRSLKYTVGLLHFHAKKAELVLQEIFARLIMYNFSELITSHVVIHNNSKKYSYKVCFSSAVHVCRQFFLDNVSPPALETLIARFVSPIRTGRNYPRKFYARTSVSFIYRIA